MQVFIAPAYVAASTRRAYAALIVIRLSRNCRKALKPAFKCPAVSHAASPSGKIFAKPLLQQRLDTCLLCCAWRSDHTPPPPGRHLFSGNPCCHRRIHRQSSVDAGVRRPQRDTQLSRHCCPPWRPRQRLTAEHAAIARRLFNGRPSSERSSRSSFFFSGTTFHVPPRCVRMRRHALGLSLRPRHSPLHLYLQDVAVLATSPGHSLHASTTRATLGL